jgi:hypothetical protein
VGPGCGLPPVEVQDEADAPDPRVDLRHASLTVSRGKRTVVLTARLQQPTSPTTPNWFIVPVVAGG